MSGDSGAPVGSAGAGDVVRVRYYMPESSFSSDVDIEVVWWGVGGSVDRLTVGSGLEALSVSMLGVPTGGDAPFVNRVAPGDGWLTFTMPTDLRHRCRRPSFNTRAMTGRLLRCSYRVRRRPELRF